MAQDACEHLHFRAEVDVHRLTARAAGPVTVHLADVRIACAQCGRPFQFLGLPSGTDTQGAAMSLDGREARLAIVPAGQVPSPLARIAAIFAPERMN